MMADGKHEAKLFDVDFCMTNAGTPAVSFVWETDDGERLSYVMALTDSTGRPNHFVIQLTRRWAMAWNGRDLSWFSENREALLGTRALLSVRDGKIEWASPAARAAEQSSSASSRMDGSSCAASPLSGCSSVNCTPADIGAFHGNAPTGLASTNKNTNPPLSNSNSNSNSSRTIHIKLIVDPAKLAEMPERVEPTFVEAKMLFDAITEGTDKLDADKVWTLMAKKIGPMQVDFGEAEWQQMIDRIKQLKSWSGTVEV